MYPSDLTDGEWAKLAVLLRESEASRHAGGRPRKYPLRTVTGAVLYVVKTGCQWRQLPINFPPWQTVYQQFRAWRLQGRWERVTKALREQGRKTGGRSSTPTVAIIDSQSAKTTGKGGVRLRRRQKDQGPQAPHRRRDARQPASGGSAFGSDSRLRGRPRRADALVPTLRHRSQGIRRRRLHGHTDRLGQGHVWLRCRGGKAKRDTHLQGVAQTMDRGKEFFNLVLIETEIERVQEVF